MSKKLLALLFALLAPTLLLAACGSDDDTAEDATEEEVVEEDATEDEVVEEEEAGIDQANLEAFIDAINEDPTIVCDEANATAELLEALGGIEGCLDGAGTETGGEPYEITDIQIDGATATVIIKDADSESTAEFVQEGDQLKLAG